jgi:TRAP-type C4-dicarboxylate transport system substrate-binding protein
VIDMAVFSTINISPQLRETDLFPLPWLLRGHCGFDAIIDGEVGQDLLRVPERREVVPLASGENGFRNGRAAGAECGDPRTVPGEDPLRHRHDLLRDLRRARRQPLQMTFADLHLALSTGVVGGQESPINLFLAVRVDALAQKYLTVWDHVAGAVMFLVAKSV